MPYRQHFNHRRPHQALPPNITPQMVWEILYHAQSQRATGSGRASARDSRAVPTEGEYGPDRTAPDETPVRPKRLLANDPANQPDGHDDYPTRIRG